MAKNALLIKTYTAGANINPYRICKLATDTTVVQSASGTDSHIFLSNEVGANAGERQDLIVEGLAEVTYGATVARGDLLTSDATGRAIPATGSNRAIGVALVSGVIGDIGSLRIMPSAPGGTLANVTASANELNTLDGAADAASTLTVGGEAANVINISIQLKDADNANLTVRTSIYAYLSDNNDGSTLIATVPSGAVVIGAAGLLMVTEAKKQFRLVTNAAGLADINITEAGVKTLYLVLILPNGKLKVSPAITFA